MLGLFRWETEWGLCPRHPVQDTGGQRKTLNGSKQLSSFPPNSFPLPLLKPHSGPSVRAEAEPVDTVSSYPLLLLSSHTCTAQTFLPPFLYHAFTEVPPALLTGSTLVCCSWKYLYISRFELLPQGQPQSPPQATKTLLCIPNTSSLSMTVDVRTCKLWWKNTVYNLLLCRGVCQSAEPEHQNQKFITKFLYRNKLAYTIIQFN